MKYIMIIPILAFVGCQSSNSVEKDKHEIEESRRQLTEESIKGNADGFDDFVTDDIIFLRPNEKDLDGKEEVNNYVSGLKDAFLSIQVDRHPINEIEIFGDLAYVRYRNSYKATRADSTSFELERKFLDIWKKEQGKWKMYRHMWGDVPKTTDKE